MEADSTREISLNPDPSGSAPIEEFRAVPAAAPRVLFVDDEPRMLKMIERNFSQSGWRLFFADGGARALEILQKERVDVLVSDMKMPVMGGCELLVKAMEKDADITCMLMSGYTDLEETVEAVNEGHVFGYIQKNASTYEFKLAVYQGYLRRKQRDDQRALRNSLRAANEELERRKEDLEARVREKTQRLRDAIATLRGAQAALEECHRITVRLFSHLIELRGDNPGHGQRVALIAQRLVEELSSDESLREQVQVAALLHDIGKVSLSDEDVRTRFSELDDDQRERYLKHTRFGAALVHCLPLYQEAARMIRSHHERFDGTGYPDGLSGPAIPLGAQVLALASDYDNIVHCPEPSRRVSRVDALKRLSAQAGTAYDPRLVRHFARILEEESAAANADALDSGSARDGMVLARDLLTRDGALLVGRDQELDESLISNLRQYEADTGDTLRLRVKPAQDAT